LMLLRRIVCGQDNDDLRWVLGHHCRKNFHA
jgi:hypothetical protein